MYFKKGTISPRDLTIPVAFKALASREIALILLLLFIYNLLLWLIPHHAYASTLSKVVVLFSAIKVYYLLAFSIRRLKPCLECCHSFYEILGVYALILGIMVVSFAVDHYCLMTCKPDAFLMTEETGDTILRAFDFLYFSMVTFATIGYGDIVPMVLEAKIIVLFEISSSFIMITFVISNLSRISQAVIPQSNRTTTTHEKE